MPGLLRSKNANKGKQPLRIQAPTPGPTGELISKNMAATYSSITLASAGPSAAPAEPSYPPPQPPLDIEESPFIIPGPSFTHTEHSDALAGPSITSTGHVATPAAHLPGHFFAPAGFRSTPENYANVDYRPQTSGTMVSHRVIAPGTSVVSLVQPVHTKFLEPLPDCWSPRYDRAICQLDARGFSLPGIVERLKRQCRELVDEPLTAEMIDVRLRILDQDIYIDYWRKALEKIDEEKRTKAIAAAAKGKQPAVVNDPSENVGPAEFKEVTNSGPEHVTVASSSKSNDELTMSTDAQDFVNPERRAKENVRPFSSIGSIRKVQRHFGESNVVLKPSTSSRS